MTTERPGARRAADDRRPARPDAPEDDRPRGTPCEDLLVPVFRGGKRVYDSPPLADVRARTHGELDLFHAGIKRFVNPHAYPVGLEKRLHDLKTELVLKARGVEK